MIIQKKAPFTGLKREREERKERSITIGGSGQVTLLKALT